MDDTSLTLLGHSLNGLLGRPLPNAQSHEALAIVAQYVQAYTRGEGFDTDGNPNDDLAAVVITAGARLLASPNQVARKEVGGLSLLYTTFQGFTVAEQMVLNRYRQRTA